LKSILVIKFGGTSIGTPHAMDQAAKIVAAEHERVPLVVVSAFCGVTDRLVGLADEARCGDLAAIAETHHFLKHRHLDQAHALLSGEAFGTYAALFTQHWSQLRDRVNAMGQCRSCSVEEQDGLLSFGEWACSRLFCLVLGERGVAVSWCDSRELLVTDDRFGNASPQLDATTNRLQEIASPILEAGTTVVTQGFIGTSNCGRTTTLGRGGSDYSATLFASLLNAQEVHIRTDVDGVFSADPNLINAALGVPELNLEEAYDLANYGAEVLYPPCLEPLRQNGIPLRVCNTFTPDNPGTLISAKLGPDPNRFFISLQQDRTLIQLACPDGACGQRFSQSLFGNVRSHLDRLDSVTFHDTDVCLITGSDSSQFLQAVSEQVRLVEVVPLALIHIFGGDPEFKLMIQQQCHSVLAGIGVPIRFFGSIGAKKHFLFGVALKHGPNAARALHHNFCEQPQKVTGLSEFEVRDPDLIPLPVL